MRLIRTTFKMIDQGESFRLDNSALANRYVKRDDGGEIGRIWVAIRPNETVFVEDENVRRIAVEASPKPCPVCSGDAGGYDTPPCVACGGTGTVYDQITINLYEEIKQRQMHCQYCGDTVHERVDSAWHCSHCGEVDAERIDE